MDSIDKLFPLIFDSINEGVFTVDESFSITSFNAEAERITGVNRDEAIGRKCHEVLKASICQQGCAMRQTLESGEPRRDVNVDVLNAEMKAVPIVVSTAILRDKDNRLVGGVEIFRDRSDVEILRRELSGRRSFRDIVGQSRAMQEIFALIPKVADSDAPVLVTGPSGTGKELVAQAIHDLSPRKKESLVRVNCGALPDTLLESELFGHVKGAFTGAVRNRPGRFQQADKGTLFLDEIGDVSPAFQVKLLRALEEGEIQPLGDTKTIKVDVRLITATNKNLEEMIHKGTFREDLFYRIRVIPIELPPLLARRKDIPLLVAHFAKLLATRSGQEIPSRSNQAMRALYDYDYPGNVRELRNIIERAFVLCSNNRIELKDLPQEVVTGVPHLAGHPEAPSSLPSIAEADFDSAPQDTQTSEIRQLRALLDANNWNRTTTAKVLGIGRTTLWRRMKDHGLV